MERDAYKCFIENVDLSQFPQNEEEWLNVTHEHSCIGYYFTNIPKPILNLYLINKKYYRKSTVSLDQLTDAHKEFENKCRLTTKRCMVFQNPPIEEWYASKDNWIKKLAAKIADTGMYPFDEALSKINWVVCKLYRRRNVYMGSLSYIETAVWNSLRCCYRDTRNKLTLWNKNVISLFAPIGQDRDGEAIYVADVIIAPKDFETREREYREFEERAREMMRPSFSDRELDQIFNNKSIFLPKSLYSRLVRWRNNNQDKIKLLREEL